MKAFSIICALLAALSARGAELNQLSAEEKAAGWRLLFNGKDLSGWRYVKGRSGPVRRCTHDPQKETLYSES